MASPATQSKKHADACKTMAIAPDSPTAIRLYVFFAALLAGGLVGYFVAVPALRKTCTWFTSRCSTIEVTSVPGSRMLRVRNLRSGQTYVYDGTYIFSYAGHLAGTCPRTITYGTSPEPLTTPTLSNFCYSFTPTPTDPECVAGNTLKCSKCASPAYQCARLSTWNEAKGGYMCDFNSTTEVPTTSFTCCAGVTGCASGEKCAVGPTYDAATKKYACGNTKTDDARCCSCMSTFHATVYGGTTQASGDILTPVYAIDASTMQITDRGNGVVCAPSERVMAGAFTAGTTKTVSINVPDGQPGLDVYQIFNVLQKQGLFTPPNGTPAQPNPWFTWVDQVGDNIVKVVKP